MYTWRCLFSFWEEKHVSWYFLFCLPLMARIWRKFALSPSATDSEEDDLYGVSGHQDPIFHCDLFVFVLCFCSCFLLFMALYFHYPASFFFYVHQANCRHGSRNVGVSVHRKGSLQRWQQGRAWSTRGCRDQVSTMPWWNYICIYPFIQYKWEHDAPT